MQHATWTSAVRACKTSREGTGAIYTPGMSAEDTRTGDIRDAAAELYNGLRNGDRRTAGQTGSINGRWSPDRPGPYRVMG